MRVASLILLMSLLLAGKTMAQPAESGTRPPRTIVVALDGTGDFTSVQEAVDAARPGDTVALAPGSYPQDVTIHSKENIKLIGAGVDKVTLLGHRERIGVLHVGKWPYGATNVEISGMTINEHGGHAVGIFNANAITLRDLRINGMLFGQQAKDVRIEHCVIGGSETTGVQFADSQAVVVGSFIHDNDHGVNVAGKSDVRLERNVITRSLFEAVVVNDRARLVLISNTLVKNGGGAAFLGSSHSEVSGNVVGLNRVGFLFAGAGQVTASYNALHNSEGNYVRGGLPNVPAPELQSLSDVTTDPGFVDAEHDDFRLRPDTTLVNRGQFPYLGALPPLSESSSGKHKN
jgi:hypothetical protein